jgi:hypothetical protein
VGAVCEKLTQPFADLRNRIRTCHANRIEPLRAGSLNERSLQIIRGQKSRSA